MVDALDLAISSRLAWRKAAEEAQAENEQLRSDLEREKDEATSYHKFWIEERAKRVAAEAKLECATKALEEIDRQYENQDLSHKDFRIGAKVVTDAALTEIAH